MGMKKLPKAVRKVMLEIQRKGGEAAMKKLTPAERKARAKAAGIASGKARRKKAGKA